MNMGKNIFQRPLLKAQASRNLFDVSHKTVFHAPFGMLLPCGHWRLAPDDKIEISEENQFVVDKINRPAFMRLKEHIDYYFVPYSNLCTYADNFFTSQSYYWSSVINKSVDESMTPKVPTQMVTVDPSFIKQVYENANTYLDECGFPNINNVPRLFDMLGYGNMIGFLQELGDTERPFADTPLQWYLDVNLFNFLAYQKIYYDFYRNDSYEANKVYAYNIDDIASGTVLHDTDFIANPNRFESIFEVHYRWRKKDYFTNVKPNNLPDTNYLGFEGGDFSIGNYGTVSDSEIINGIPNVYTAAVTNSVNSGNTSVNSGNGVVARYNQQASPGVYTTNVQAIRFAFAYDKLLRRMREAGQDFDRQMLAQFGITPIDQRHGKCHYIGGFTNRLNASSVNGTSDMNLGNIGSNIDVYSVNNKNKLHFTAKEHGILMAIYSTSLDFDYSSARLDRENIAKHRFDWQHPAFEKQGNQPIFGFEYFMFKGIDQQSDANWYAKNVIGLVDRYSEYKTHVDELHGLFCPDVSPFVDFKSWVTNPGNFISGDSLSALSMEQLIFSPKMISTIVPVPYDGTWQTDPFKINMYHRIKKISSMSVYGEDFGH